MYVKGTFLKDTDVVLLKELRKDAQVTLNTIKKTYGIPTSTSFDRISYIEKSGFIKGYTVLLTPSYLSKYLKRIYLLEGDAFSLKKSLYLNTLFSVSKNRVIVEMLFPSRTKEQLFERKQTILEKFCIKEIIKKESLIF